MPTRIKCRNCGAESYAAGDTGLVCISCYDKQAKRIEELEAGNEDLKTQHEEDENIYEQIAEQNDFLIERVKELEAENKKLKEVAKYAEAYTTAPPQLKGEIFRDMDKALIALKG